MSQCDAEERIGGLTDFHAGDCSTTPEEAAQLVRTHQPVENAEASQLVAEPVNAPEEGGCCFSIGYGALMRPCCLTTETVLDMSTCASGKRLGGFTAFHAGDCPATAEDAALLIQTQETERLTSKNPVEQTASIDVSGDINSTPL